MNKVNKTYINNLFNKILTESLEERVDDIVTKLSGEDVEEMMNQPVDMIDEGNSEMCEQCGSEMTEGSGGLCEQCSSKMESIDEQVNEEYDEEKCEYHTKNFGEDDERTKRFCNSKTETMESLKGGQKKLDKNQNGKIDSEDFKMMRNKKKESKEGKEYRGKFDGRKSKVIGVDSDIDQQRMEESKKTKLKLTESELISLIEKIVKEQKSNITKGKSAGESEYNTIHKESGKENEDYIKDVTKKMKDYLKNGSKGDYSMDPKMFPQGNGEIEKMKKAAYVPSEDVRDYVEAFTAAGQENLDYDEIKPNDEWLKKNIEGSSETGNNPEWANAVETPVNKRRNKIRKDNLLAKAKRKAYNKAEQPVVQDKTGEDEGDKILTKLESTQPKKNKKLNEEFEAIKNLISYDRKTQ